MAIPYHRGRKISSSTLEYLRKFIFYLLLMKLQNKSMDLIQKFYTKC